MTTHPSRRRVDDDGEPLEAVPRQADRGGPGTKEGEEEEEKPQEPIAPDERGD